jgi:hypothetical protein
VPRERAARLETCQRRLAEDWRTERRANRAYEAYRARGVMRDGRRFGLPPKPYNAQAVTTEDQIIVAAEITTKGGDFEELDPMITAAEGELAAAGGLRANQDEPADRPLQTQRPGGRTLGRAPDCGHPQPAEAPPEPTGGHRSLIEGPKRPAVFWAPRFSSPAARARAFTRQPHAKAGADGLLRLVQSG